MILPGVVILTSIIFLLIAFLTRGITFFTTNTNNEKQVRAAARFNEWRWPSDMHRYTLDKARMKDAGVLGLALFQRLLGDKETEYPLIFLCNLACGFSAVLIYLVASHYWDVETGLLVFALFLFCFWPHQITLQGTYQCLALMFFLDAVFCLQQQWYLSSGVAFGLMLFASAAVRKFFPIFAGALFYHVWAGPGVIRPLLSFGAGSLLVILFFILPDVVQNLKGYWHWWRNNENACHFLLYKKYFEAIGKPISDKMRGAGWRWVGLLFFKMVPFHSAAFLFSIGLTFYACFKSGFELGFIWRSIAVLLLSLAPLFYAEMTRAPQLARSYFPGFVGMLLWIAYGVFHFERMLDPQARFLFREMVAVFVLLSAFWNTWIFLDDVWPSRMAVACLAKKITKLGIKKIHTYDTSFNEAFVKALHPRQQNNCEIKYIRSLNEVENGGYVAVPGTSAKALNMEAQPQGVEGRDFDQDPVLIDLIHSKKIADVAVASFKTFGTSKVWVHESEMPSYRALILKDIGERDRWRGRAWLLNVGKGVEYVQK